ncbi:MAG: hydrogenase 4 subunit F [Thermoplasmatales archaeon]|nr:hydrogenase 4 subunit F [Thermoplasmatales archaeon]
MVTLTAVIPIVAGAVCLLPFGVKNVSRISAAGALVMLAASVYCCVAPLTGETIDTWIWYVDELSGFFILITAFVSFAAVLYSTDYLAVEWREERLNAREVRRFYCTLFVFISTMLLTFAVRSAALTWIGVGVTTMVSAFLVGLYKDESATEAAWKYIMLCSVGITLALFGIAMLYTASSGVVADDSALDWPTLVANAAAFNPLFMKFAAIFLVIGFGTKAGLAPLHNWLPDAHSQAPGPVSGMMSGVLLNCAMYAIMRFYSVSEIVNPGFVRTLLLAFGIVSVFTAAAFILISKDFKRMLAYSSVENMGLIAIGLGIGTPLAIYGALFQTLAHSLCKPMMFFCAGNVIQAYGTRSMPNIRGVSGKMRFTGFATAGGALAVAGAPPFPMFVGEVMILYGAVNEGLYLFAGALAILLAFIFAGITRSIFPMLSGTTSREVFEHRSVLRGFAIFSLFACALFFGLFMPEPIRGIFETMIALLSGGST